MKHTFFKITLRETLRIMLYIYKIIRPSNRKIPEMFPATFPKFATKESSQIP